MAESKDKVNPDAHADMPNDQMNIAACLQKINSRLDKLDVLEKVMTEHISAQTEIVTLLTAKVNTLEARVDTLEDIVRENDAKIEDLEQNIATQEATIHVLRGEKEATEVRVNDLEQYSKRDNLVIDGLKFYVPYAVACREPLNGNHDDSEDDRLTPRDRDIMADNFVSFVQDCLEITMSTNDIVDIHVLTSKSNRKNPASSLSGRKVSNARTIVRFNNRRMRDRILVAARKLLKKKGKQIFVNEHLTKINSDIFKAARDAKRAGSIKNTWTKNCKIFISQRDDKVVMLRSISQLQRIIDRNIPV